MISAFKTIFWILDDTQDNNLTWNFRGVSKENLDVGLGLVVRLSLGQIQVRSGSLYRSNLILLSLTLK